VEFGKSTMESLEITMKSLTNKKILVTGGTGFVGSHLVEALIKRGAEVITTYISLDPRSYFMMQCLDKKVTTVPVDITEFDKLFDIVTKLEVDFIFHLAAQPLVETAFYNPKRTFESNINGTINILEAARLYPRIKGVIFASSDKAYGKNGEKKYKETDRLQGDHPYEVSKSAADLIVSSYYKTYKLPVITTRFGNIYGEGDLNFSRIIPGALRSIITKTPLEIRSDGSYVRDYLYVKDVADGYLMLAEQLEHVAGEAFNFGSSDTLSVKDLLKEIQTITGIDLDYKVVNISKNEIPYQSLEYSKIQKKIKWRPKYDLEKTIPRMLEWYKKIL